MKILNHDDLRELIGQPGPCVSIYVPTHPGGRDQQDEIRIKNVVGQATDELLERGLRRSEAEKMVAPVKELPRREAFWSHRSDGVACFCGRDFFRAYRVPLSLEEQLYVTDRFHVKPLLPLLRADARFYVLSLSQEDACLYEATRFSIRELDLPSVARAELDGTEQAQQYHSHRAPSQGKGATDEAIYHGHGGIDDRSKTDIRHFFERVARAVGNALQNQRAPLVLACVGYLAPIYDTANRYQQLIKAKVPGNPKRWTLDELRSHALRLVEPYLLRGQHKALEQFARNQSTSRASDRLREVVLAADSGRVESLIVQKGARQWGRIEPQLQAVHVCDDASEGEEELLDYAAARTLANGGEVYVVDDIPQTDSPIAATFRY